MEKIDISKIKEKNDSPQTKKLLFLKIYQEGIQNKSKCPPSLFNIIINIIILIVLIIIKKLLLKKKERLSYLFSYKLFY